MDFFLNFLLIILIVLYFEVNELKKIVIGYIILSLKVSLILFLKDFKYVCFICEYFFIKCYEVI